VRRARKREGAVPGRGVALLGGPSTEQRLRLLGRGRGRGRGRGERGLGWAHHITNVVRCPHHRRLGEEDRAVWRSVGGIAGVVCERASECKNDGALSLTFSSWWDTQLNLGAQQGQCYREEHIHTCTQPHPPSPPLISTVPPPPPRFSPIIVLIWVSISFFAFSFRKFKSASSSASSAFGPCLPTTRQRPRQYGDAFFECVGFQRRSAINAFSNSKRLHAGGRVPVSEEVEIGKAGASVM
jgi:hypothetical protein